MKKKLKIIRLRQIIDDDDPWVEYPIEVALRCGVLKRNPRRGEFIYVAGEEEHCILEANLHAIGLTARYTSHWVKSLKTWIKGDQWPKAKAWAGGKWPKGSVWRDYEKT